METGKTGLPEQRVRTGKYLKYAVGEIILVVIGILFALQVNNWNQQRIEQNTIQGYYAKLLPALGIEIEDQKTHLARLEVFRNDFYRSLEILDVKNPDDIEELKLKIARLGQAFVHNYSMELFDEFLSKGFLTKLEDEALKSQFETVKRGLAIGASWDALLDDEYISIIKPFRIKNLNFSIIPLDRISLENESPKGGPEFDYTNLFNNKEAWNIVYGRLASLNTTIRQKKDMIEALQTLKATLEEKVNN
jgi:hypothetical protein